MINIAIDYLSLKEKLTIKTEAGKQWIFDIVRKKYLRLLPEELVRQLVVLYLLKLGYTKSRIAIEKEISVNQRKKRFDILVYDQKLQPIILVECKAPSIKITQKTFEQIAWYNMSLKVDYLIVTNGIDTFCCEMDYGANSFRYLAVIPKAKAY